jgi:single-strand DNA-binding protein
MINKVIVQGRIAFDLELKGTEGKEYLNIGLSVRRDYKKPDEQYYPEDLFRVSAFGKTAVMISNNFARQDYIMVEGRLALSDDYEKDGQVIKGQPYIKVDQVHFMPNGGNKSNTNNATAAPKAPAAPQAAAPLPVLKPLAKPVLTGKPKM